MGRIAIIGLGLIGGSLGMAWRQAQVGMEVVGHDREPEAGRVARKKGAVDRVEWNLPAAVEKADLVVLATPVGAMREILGHIADCLPANCIVTDTGSTKRQVMAWAEELLPSSVSFVGGHPMAGKETPGIEAAEAGLFAGCTYCLTPSSSASSIAVDTLCKLVMAIGAEPYFLDPSEHDGLVAGVSHLPFVASAALVRTATSSRSWREMSRLAASGFRDVSRLASGDPTVYASICQTNRENVVRWLDAYIAELGRLRDLIENDDQGLGSAFGEAKAARDRWLTGADQQPDVRVDIPSFREQMGQSIFGSGRLWRGPGDKGRG